MLCNFCYFSDAVKLKEISFILSQSVVKRVSVNLQGWYLSKFLRRVDGGRRSTAVADNAEDGGSDRADH